MRQLFLLLFTLLISGCGTHVPRPSATAEQRLSSMIISVDRTIDKSEAKHLAHEALMYSYTLSKKYKVDTSPWMHNFLVNVGIKKRGLCYQWADDLAKHLSRLDLKTIKLLPIGANIGKYWTEHNAVVVLPSRRNIPLDKGVILDAWRHSGNLYYAPVARDTKYKWSIRTERLHIVQQ